MTVQTNHLEDVDTAIDWDATPQCQHSQHNEDPAVHAGDAVWHASSTCPNCRNTYSGLRCQGWYDFAASDTWCTITCQNCDAVCPTSEYFAQTVWTQL